MSQLAAFPAGTALEILDEFAGSDMRFVRNKSAYLAGVMGRFRKYGGNAKLHLDIQSRLDQLFNMGMLQPGDLDARCIDAMQTLPLHVAVRAIDRFAERDLRDIRNVSAFFMSNVKATSQELEEEDNYASLVQHPPPPPPPRPRPNPHTVQQQGTGAQRGRLKLPRAPQLLTVCLTAGHRIPMAPAASSQPSLSSKKSYAIDQGKMGVRIDEFHALSVFAVFVHPAPALKLQQLWDDGNALVSLLDDPAWCALSDIGAPEALATIEETAAQLTPHNHSQISSILVVSSAPRPHHAG